MRRLQRYWGWGHRRGQPTGRSRSHRRVEGALRRNDITRNSDVDAADVTNARVSADDIASEGDAVYCSSDAADARGKRRGEEDPAGQ